MKLPIVSAAFFFIACGPNVSPDKPGSTGADSSITGDTITNNLQGVETKPPNTAYKPAFAGQTRIIAVKTSTPYEATVLSTGLKTPWGIAVLPDGRLLITERAGTMRIATPAGKLSKDITSIPAVRFSGQGGLLGLTIDPQFSQNRMVYWVFSEVRPDGNVTAVAKGRLSADERRIEGAMVIYRAMPAFSSTHHYGGRITFDKTGNLFISTGEGFDTQNRPQAQDKKSALGKVLHITKDGEAAPGNPFAGQKNALPELYSCGHRNPEGLAIHPQTGDLWESELGPRGGDEINHILPGRDYGWPTITYGIEYTGEKVGSGSTQHSGMEQPVYYWDPVQSPSGITFYEGNFFPEWKNDLFVSGLSSSHIARLVIRNNKVTGEEWLLRKEGQRFRDIAVGKDGALYIITDEGRLYRIGKK